MKCMAREDFEEDEVLKVMKDLCGDVTGTRCLSLSIFFPIEVRPHYHLDGDLLKCLWTRASAPFCALALSSKH